MNKLRIIPDYTVSKTVDGTLQPVSIKILTELGLDFEFGNTPLAISFVIGYDPSSSDDFTLSGKREPLSGNQTASLVNFASIKNTGIVLLDVAFICFGFATQTFALSPGKKFFIGCDDANAFINSYFSVTNSDAEIPGEVTISAMVI